MGVLLVAALLIATPSIGGDTAGELGRSLAATPRLVGHPAWPLVALLAGIAALHYLLAGIAVQAAAGRDLAVPIGESTLVQLVATVANRITPAGTGGAAVNVRYLTRRGLTVSAAVGAIAALSLLGALADLIALLLLLLLSVASGAPQAAPAVRQAGRHLDHLADAAAGAPGRIVVALVAVALLGVVLRQWTSHPLAAAVAATLGFAARAGRHLALLRTRPRDLAVLMLASAGTTLILAAGLVVSVAAVAGVPVVRGSIGSLAVAYLVGSALGGAVPVPAGLGSTEAALTAALVAAGIPLAQAVSAVLLFRAVTFWGPVPAGLLAGRRLRRRKAI